MNKIDKLIEIVVTDNDWLSLMPKNTCKMIYNVLQKKYLNVEITTINNSNDLEKLIKRSPDLVVSWVKNIIFENNNVTDEFSKEIWLSECLDNAWIKYTGSNKKALQLEFNKSNAKNIIQSVGINTSEFFLARPGQFTKSEDLPVAFPILIKPLYGGDWKWIDIHSVAHDFEGYEKKVKDIFQEYNTDSMVERYLNWREFTVWVIDDGLWGLTIMPLELIATENDMKDRILGEQAKNEDKEKAISIKDSKIYKDVSELAENAFNALWAKDFGRIDIRMDKEWIPYFLEANLVPWLWTWYFFRTCHITQQMTYEEMIFKIVKLGLIKPCNKSEAK